MSHKQAQGKPKGDPSNRFMTEQLRILLVEDVADDAELELLELKRAGLSVAHSNVMWRARSRSSTHCVSSLTIAPIMGGRDGQRRSDCCSSRARASGLVREFKDDDIRD